MKFKVIIVGNHKPSSEQLTDESKQQLLRSCGLEGRFSDVEFIEATPELIPFLSLIG